MKGKGEGERYIELNAEFQRITRRNRKVFLNEKKMQRNRGKQRMGKIRDIFKKISDIKGLQ